jgi:hypothetical protein
MTTARSSRDRDDWTPANRGYFIDVRTIAAALTSRKHSLASLGAYLGVSTQKQQTEEHGGPLTADYLDYACADVQCTWECYLALKAKYGEHQLATPLHRILSEASIGKAYLKQMNVQPLLACQPDASRQLFGTIMSAYFGGRAEVRTRKQIAQVYYCDFKSMYPTVNALMGLARFLVSDGFSHADATLETQALLSRITLDDLQSRETWGKLATLVKLRPKGTALPFRTRYTKDGNVLTIGLNHVTSAKPLWYTLADVIASKLLTGQTPQIDQAITFTPGAIQQGLRPIRLFGRDEYTIDPATDDLFTRFIDLRDEAKAKRDPIEKALKILANATCYGIFAEVLRDDAPKPEPIGIFGPDFAFETTSIAIEEPGRYFHPLLATLITGAARLMLGTAERLAETQGLDWVFCDTDSIAMARPEGMSEVDFYAKAETVIRWFEGLNPYQLPGSILKAEDLNFEAKSKGPKPLYCYAISAQRYALFNLDNNGKPVIRKVSAHGLGHLMAPYEDDNPPKGIPNPEIPLSELGVRRWQYDLWFQIIQAALAGNPNRVLRNYHLALEKPALMRYGATSPAMLRWMKHFNAGKSYRDRVKPFGFLVSLSPRTGAFSADMSCEMLSEVRRGRPRKASGPKPIAPFERDSVKALVKAFDRETGEAIQPETLKSYAEALALYHLSPEDKFENGGPFQIGRTERRDIVVTNLALIGKEANKVGESGLADPVASAVVQYDSKA